MFFHQPKICHIKAESNFEPNCRMLWVSSQNSLKYKLIIHILFGCHYDMQLAFLPVSYFLSQIDSRNHLHMDLCVISCGQIPQRTLEMKRLRNILLTTQSGVVHTSTGEDHFFNIWFSAEHFYTLPGIMDKPDFYLKPVSKL